SSEESATHASSNQTIGIMRQSSLARGSNRTRDLCLIRNPPRFRLRIYALRSTVRIARKSCMATNEREMWLAQVSESILEPALPIVDPHHPLGAFPTSRYLLDELLRDTGSGHRVIATVFVECGSMYRGDGPRAFKPIGETEFVNGIAAQSAS